MMELVEPRSCPKRKFTPEEDDIIRKCVAEKGTRNWNYVAQFLPQRSGKQVRERYVNYLKPDVSKRPWTSEEEKLLIRLVKTNGNKWSTNATYFENRTDISLKNHWVNICRKIKKSQNFLNSPSDSALSEPENVKDSSPEPCSLPQMQVNDYQLKNPQNKAITTPKAEKNPHEDQILWEDIFSEGLAEYDWNQSELLIL